MQRGLALLGSGDTQLRGAMMNRLLHRRDLIGDQEPAFAMAIGTIGIARMITAGQSWNSIQAATGCSRATIAKIAKRVKAAAQPQAPSSC